jgi:hypothetical protein
MTGTSVATRSAGTSLIDRAKNGVNPYLDDAGSDDFFGTFLKFSGNSGEYNYGDDYAEELIDGSELILNGATIQHGWICWVDGEVMDEVNVLVSSGKPFPKESELENYGPYETHSDGTKDGWQEQYIFHLYHEKSEQAFTLKLSSRSALRAAKNLVRQYGKAFFTKIADDGVNTNFPLIEIGNTSFDVKKEDGSINKKAGKKYAPVFKIVDWIDYNEVAQFFEAAGGDDAGDYDDEDEDEAPARGRGKAAPAKKADKGSARSRRSRDEDEDEEEEKPARGRGRKAAAVDEDEDEEEEKPVRGRGRKAAAVDEDEDEEEEKPVRGRGRKAAAVDEDEEEEKPARGRGRKAAAVDEDEDEDEEEEAPKASAGKRARVVHADPQDDEDEDDSDTRANPRESARGRRGRTR